MKKRKLIFIIFILIVIIIFLIILKNKYLTIYNDTYFDDFNVVTNKLDNENTIEIEDNNSINNINKTIYNNYEFEIEENTITKSGATIIITNLDRETFKCGEDFYIQEKINNNWTDLEMKENSIWNTLTYISDENGQFEQKINWTDYYGTLSNGTYRIVKTIYSNEKTTLYTDEFKID